MYILLSRTMPIITDKIDPRIERIEKEIIDIWKKKHPGKQPPKYKPTYQFSKKQSMTPEDWFATITLIILFIVLFFPIWF